MSHIVDVVMPVYNAAPYLKFSIESILNQSFSDFWFIIIDDGSTDWSREILQQYAKRDTRIQLLRNKNNSWICVSLNKAIDHSNATYILRMDADDISDKDRIRIQVEFMEKHMNVWVCGCNVQCINKEWSVSFIKKYPYTDEDIRKKIFFFNPINHPWAIMRRSALDKAWLYNDNFILAEDLDLWFRLWQYSKFANIPQVLLQYRIFDTNSTHRKSQKMVKQAIKTRMMAIRKYWYKPGVIWWLAITMAFVIQYLSANIVHLLFYKLRSVVQ